MKLNNSSILTMEDRAINGDPRISLLHPYAAEWNLQIDDVDEDDAGIYRCVINTGMYKTLILDVKGNAARVFEAQQISDALFSFFSSAENY